MTSHCYTSDPIYGVSDQEIPSSLDANSSSPAANPTSFLYNLSVLKDKIHQVESLANIFLSRDHGHHPESTAIAIPTIGTLIQEIIVTASSMMFACQQMSLGSPRANAGCPIAQLGSRHEAVEGRPSGSFFADHHDTVDHWYVTESYNEHNNNHSTAQKSETDEGTKALSSNNYDIVELQAADLLAKYTHYCQVCGKGFKRDANLRMHMRAHGDEYKSSAALSNPSKTAAGGSSVAGGERKKYSCPQEGCRWNKNHVKFQPLKSMICVKNHYKRSHCPKMYVCKRCNRKQFSVLSDLRTHEKHCGDLKWMCSCGTTFSRKDKLMGHVALFIGHIPAINSSAKIERR